MKVDIDVLLVDKSKSATHIYHSTERQYKMKELYCPGYVMLFRGSKIILSKGFKKIRFPARRDKSSGNYW